MAIWVHTPGMYGMWSRGVEGMNTEEIAKRLGPSSIGKVLDTTENLIQRMEEFARKMDKAEIVLCDLHQLEFADFEKCPACEREEHESREERDR